MLQLDDYITDRIWIWQILAVADADVLLRVVLMSPLSLLIRASSDDDDDESVSSAGVGAGRAFLDAPTGTRTTTCAGPSESDEESSEDEDEDSEDEAAARRLRLRVRFFAGGCFGGGGAIVVNGEEGRDCDWRWRGRRATGGPGGGKV